MSEHISNKDLYSEFSIFKTLSDELDTMWKKSRALGIPRCYDGYIGYGEKLGQIKGKTSEQANLISDVKKFADKINNIQRLLHGIYSESEDLMLGLTNSFHTEYDCDMFHKGWAYQVKFINKKDYWACRFATEDFKKQYDECYEFFKKITAGLKTHNFKILYYDDGTMAEFAFTVENVPGDFEIYFPLNSDKMLIKDDYLEKSHMPMMMSLAWRRRWIIPVFDYFFDNFGSYTSKGINKKLHEFISTRKYDEFYNTKTYIKKVTDPTTFCTTEVEGEYDEETKAYLAKLLAEEIEANGKEGKKSKF